MTSKTKVKTKEELEKEAIQSLKTRASLFGEDFVKEEREALERAKNNPNNNETNGISSPSNNTSVNNNNIGGEAFDNKLHQFLDLEEIESLVVQQNEEGMDEKKQTDEILNLEIAGDMNEFEMDFDEIDDDLAKFQQDEIVKEALNRGVDLGTYSRSIDKELEEAEALVIGDYLRESDSLASLHNQIKQCDTILERMQNRLSKFQGDLGNISSEIKHLQDKSMTMNIKLRNRKVAEGQLAEFITHVIIPDELAGIIIQGKIDDKFLEALRVLNEKIKFIQQPWVTKQSLAAREVEPSLRQLKLKAIERIRTYLFQEFYALKVPKTNIQVKQRRLAKSCDLYKFLIEHASWSGWFNSNNINLSQSSLKGNDLKENDSNSRRLSQSATTAPATDVASEIRNNYIEIMSKLYYEKLQVYLKNMKKLLWSGWIMDRNDVLGADESKSGGIFTSKRTTEQLFRMFSLERRDSVLSDAEKDIILFHVASKSGQKFPYERIFRSSQQLLMDCATSEYDFITEFFVETPLEDSSSSNSNSSSSSSTATPGASASAISSPSLSSSTSNKPSTISSPSLSTSTTPSKIPTTPTSQTSQRPSTTTSRRSISISRHTRDQRETMFVTIFSKTFSLFLEHLEDYLFSCYDPLGLLIMIRIVCQHNNIMQSQRVTCLDSFFDRINMLLWPRFKMVFDGNLESLTKIKPTVASIGNTVGLHYVTKRYAEFVCGILRLNTDYNDEILTSNLKRLRTEMEKLLVRSASTLTPPKKQVIFLINNYLHITKVINAKGIHSDETTHFNDLANTQIALYVEQELEKFGRLITFIKETEAMLDAKEKTIEEDKKKEFKVDLAAAEAIVRHFAKFWKDNIDQIATSVNKNFSSIGDEDSKNRETEILKQVLAQLMLYYTRFQDVLKKVCPGQPFMKELVPKQTIIYELRQYRSAE